MERSTRPPRTGCKAQAFCHSHTAGELRISRVYNFSAGPAALPEEVLAQAREEMLDWQGSGMSVMEMSHRSKEYISIATQAEADLRFQELEELKNGTRPEEKDAAAAELADVKVFHAGTKQTDDQVVTAGGRVLGVTALGETISIAKLRAYTGVKCIRWDGAWCRKDISDKARMT